MNVGIVGGGQLARMLALAGIPLGMDFVFLVDRDEHCVQRLGKVVQANGYQEAVLKDFADQVDFLTYETENLPTDVMKKLDQYRALAPNIDALACTQDRANELALLQSLNIPTPKTIALTEYATCEALLADFSYPFLLKRKQGGFDGRGQQIFSDDNPLTPEHFASEQALSVAQEMIAFSEEVSCITVHDQQLQSVTYPLCLNQHQHGILNTTLPLPAHPLAALAEKYNRMIAEKLNYVGTLVVEYFVVGEQLMVNEIAPRVHNSGHWTIEGSVTSQFENHLRAVTNLPLGDTQLLTPTLMVNILGQWPNRQDLLSFPALAVHDYQKASVPNRKIGHLTIITRQQIDAFIERAAEVGLPLFKPDAILKAMADRL